MDRSDQEAIEADVENTADRSLQTARRIAQITRSYVSSNQVEASSLSTLICDLAAAFDKIAMNGAVIEKPSKPIPAVPIKRSVTNDYIVCLEDGLKFKTLKRHLQSHYNMTIEEYKKKWNLPANYPTVAFNYARRRTELAKANGLGGRIARSRAVKAKA
ncbi:MucR family transcriptional regulator [Labrys neptuniae]|uniref:MucR family transcriptional regulator n=1 Tax=Labrys neptuniae TaxID=376174 RepID=A0ABV3PXV4_9HYPH